MTLFAHARRRLTVLYVVLCAIVVVVFSLVFFFVVALTLSPDFDIGPETTDQAAEVIYQATLQQIAVALVVADLAVIVVIALLARLLAVRTLGPIREAHERQRRFVADASHEMRSPIAAIRTASESALSGAGMAPAQRKVLEQVNAASARLARLSTDLLVLARSEDGWVAPHREVIDLSVTVAEAVRLHVTATGSGRLKLELQPDLTVRADPEEITRIVDNLVDNAVRYGGPDVAVRVTTRSTDRQALVEVADNGPGISQEDRERVFQPFYRVRSDAAAPSGNGLGLAISARLAGKHHGRLTLEPGATGGSVFRLALPRFR